MLAVVEISKKQYLVKKGSTYEVEKLKEREGEIVLDKVLLLADGKKIKIGTPYLDNARVKAEVVGEKKGKKIVIYKYKRRKKYRRKIGHRQTYTLLKISDIVAPRASRITKKETIG
jgi:large subunit ribosomal protein L21